MTALLIAAAFPATAHAQETAVDQAPAEETAGDDQEVLVTARRTEERLQDVPVSVTAIGAAELQNAGVTDLTAVQQLSPSLNITPLNGVGTAATVSIRGQAQTTAGIGVDPSTGVYINEVYVARPAGLNASLFDVQNVQVLRGPQGTLFGRNSVGGAVLIETRRPGRDLGGYVDVSVEDPWGYNLEAALNVPITEGVGLRLAGQRQYVRGYSRVVGADYRLDDTDSWSGRATLDVQVGDFRSTFIADAYHSSVNGPATYPLPFNPALMTAANPIRAAYIAEYNASLSRPFRLASQDRRTYGVADTGGVANITTWDITPDIRVKNILGYRYQRADDTVNHDALAATVLFTQVESDTRQYSEELQLQASLFDDSLDLILGGYYFSENGTDYSNSYSLRPANSIARSQNRFRAENSAISGFAHASWTVPIGVPAHLFGGIRLTRDTRVMFFRTRNILADGTAACAVPNGGPTCNFRAEEDFPATTWDVGFDIKPIPEILLYASVARGYRTGGFNGRATNLTQELPFQSEFVTSYEAGIKSEWESGGVRGTFNLSGFYADYSDIQRTTVIVGPAGPQSSVANAASAHIQGLEAEAAVIVNRDLRLRAFYSFIDPQYDEYLDNGVDRTANEFPFVPRHQAGAAADWVFARDTRGDQFALNANWSYRAGFFLEIINTPTTRVEGYHLFNASLRWENIRGTGMSAELYARNLFDTDYNRGGFSVYTSIGAANVVRGDPRVIGVSLRVPFGGER
ncbi:MAG TPA: TonB-dependent receptor [Allosphingosinicella sp.]|nr:TonB-dependent receptor [Allosphingosinicella sp.]